MSRTLTINRRRHAVASAPDTPLLWVLRDELALTGTKFGCGAALCGACTVHLNGQPVRSCVLPVQAVGAQPVTTVEALHTTPIGRALQRAWLAGQVAQCGYCQSGMLMAAAALLAKNPAPRDADIDAAMTHVCRCGTYPRVRQAIHAAARELAGGAPARAAVGAGAVVDPVGGVAALDTVGAAVPTGRVGEASTSARADGGRS